MPIYAYKCASCGFAKDVLQKISDAPLSTCPACGQEAFAKQLTAAGFQLKGSGWYVTDFRDAGGAKKSTAEGDGKPAEAAKDGGSASPAPTAPAASAAPAPAAPASPAPASAPAAAKSE